MMKIRQKSLSPPRWAGDDSIIGLEIGISFQCQTTQTDSQYIRYTAANVLRSTTPCTSEGHWLMYAW